MLDNLIFPDRITSKISRRIKLESYQGGKDP